MQGGPPIIVELNDEDANGEEWRSDGRNLATNIVPAHKMKEAALEDFHNAGNAADHKSLGSSRQSLAEEWIFVPPYSLDT